MLNLNRLLLLVTSTAILVAAYEGELLAYIQGGCKNSLNWKIWNKYDEKDPAIVALSKKDREYCEERALIARVSVIMLIVVACIVFIVICILCYSPCH
ncbi:MAG: hypothetical protein MHMPM18_002962 [Marteilia pararefringens]